MQRVRVRFKRNVLGRRAGDVDWIEATPMVETLVRVGYLTWLDEPKDDGLGWLADDRTVLVELPTGETIPADELVERLTFEDDGNEDD